MPGLGALISFSLGTGRDPATRVCEPPSSLQVRADPKPMRYLIGSALKSRSHRKAQQ